MIRSVGVVHGIEAIRKRAAAGQPMKAWTYYRHHGLWDAYEPFVQEAHDDRLELLDLLDAAEARQPDASALRTAARDYLLHDGSGIGRSDEWRGDFDAMALSEARERLHAALAALPPSAPPALDERMELAEAIFEAGVRQTMSQSEQAADNILAERAIIRARLAQDRSPEPER